jgi:hypothetical protein
VRSRPVGLLLILCFAVGVAACGSSPAPGSPGTSTAAGASVKANTLAASLKSVLITKYKSPQPVSVRCSPPTIRAGQTASCDALSSAGQGYRVVVRPPCWTATFNGKIIEGPGLLPPGQRPKGPVATGPDNLPNSFSGCLK